MAYTGLLKPKAGRQIRAGLFWGGGIGLLLSLGITRLNMSEYSAANDLIFNLSRSSWWLLTIPGHCMGAIFGLEPEFNSAEPALGDFALLIASNSLLFGAVGAL